MHQSSLAVTTLILLSLCLTCESLATKYFTFDGWPNSRVTFYLDVRNLTNEKSVRWMDSNARIGGELGDPGGYFIGRRTYLGFTAEF